MDVITEYNVYVYTYNNKIQLTAICCNIEADLPQSRLLYGKHKHTYHPHKQMWWILVRTHTLLFFFAIRSSKTRLFICSCVHHSYIQVMHCIYTIFFVISNILAARVYYFSRSVGRSVRARFDITYHITQTSTIFHSSMLHHLGSPYKLMCSIFQTCP